MRQYFAALCLMWCAVSYAQTAALPFFDDFANAHSGRVDTLLWQPSAVWAGSTYTPAAQQTRAAATFDILNANGIPYPQASGGSFAADTLASRTLPLPKNIDSAFVAFNFMAGGTGDMPEREDSLLLYFFSTQDQKWYLAWTAATSAALGMHSDSLFITQRYFLLTQPTTCEYEPAACRPTSAKELWNPARFTGAVVEVPASFADTGFRFMFINMASRAGSEVTGMRSNCDMWHLDYVYANVSASPTRAIVEDVAIQRQPVSFLKTYTAIPWRHFAGNTKLQREQALNPDDGDRMSLPLYLRNMSSAPNSGVAADLHLRLVQGGSWALTYDNLGGVQNLGGYETRLTTHNISPMFSEPDDNADSVAIEVRFVIRRYRSSIAPHFAHNDTAVYVQKFYDYYAYDDGTAENGYGVFGENSQAAEIAVRYHSYRRDTLTGVFIYFNHSIGGGNIEQPFLLNIRAGGAVPSETLYTLQCTTQFDGLNRFVWYKFDRRVVVEGDFFVGIKQQNTTMLNIGVDANNINAGKVFVRLDLGWKPSQMDSAGVLMIRPSFARRTDFTDIPTLAPAVRRQGAPALYPNPVVSEARLALPSGAEGIAPSGLTINVLDIMGRSVRRLPFAYAISAEGLPAGVYLLQVEYPDGAPAFAVRKFVVIR